MQEKSLVKTRDPNKISLMNISQEQVLKLARYGIIKGDITEISIQTEISEIKIHLILILPRGSTFEEKEDPETGSMSEEEFSSFLSFLSLRSEFKFIPVNKNEALQIINTLIARPEWILDYEAQFTFSDEYYKVVLDILVPNFLIEKLLFKSKIKSGFRY